MIYNSGTGSSIGSLLRLIQEEKASQQANMLPAADPSSPVRQTVQEPLKSPESVGSDRMISIKPESAIQQGPEGRVIGPAAAGMESSSPFPVVRPASPLPSQTSGNSFMNQSGVSNSQSRNNIVAAPSVMPSNSPAKSVLGTSSPAYKGVAVDGGRIGYSTPKQSSIGGTKILEPKEPNGTIGGQVWGVGNTQTGRTTTPTPTMKPSPTPAPQQLPKTGSAYGSPKQTIDWNQILKNIFSTRLW